VPQRRQAERSFSSGKYANNYGKSPSLIGKSIIHYFDWAMASIAIFVCLPEGKAETWISP